VAEQPCQKVHGGGSLGKFVLVHFNRTTLEKISIQMNNNVNLTVNKLKQPQILEGNHFGDQIIFNLDFFDNTFSTLLFQLLLKPLNQSSYPERFVVFGKKFGIYKN